MKLLYAINTRNWRQEANILQLPKYATLLEMSTLPCSYSVFCESYWKWIQVLLFIIVTFVCKIYT